MAPEALPIFLTGLIAVIITVAVFTRLAGDNPVYRFVQYLFVGVSLGYAFVVVYHQVLRPNALLMLRDLSNPGLLGVRLVPFLLGLLLLTRITKRQNVSWMANIPLALLFGVAAALALGGALAGTLAPQLLATARPDLSTPATLIGSIFLALGVVITLAYFYFTIPRETAGGRLVAASARLGRWLLMIAFGFFFAGGLLTYLTALNERLEFIVNFFRSPFG